MSAVTPDHVLSQIAQGSPRIVKTSDFRKYMLDTDGWFMWWGTAYDIEGKNIGAGLTRMNARPRYPREARS